jgi:hypothetical protein
MSGGKLINVTSTVSGVKTCTSLGHCREFQFVLKKDCAVDGVVPIFCSTRPTQKAQDVSKEVTENL